MDRNTIIGLVLIAGVVLTWTIFFTGGDKDPQPKPKTENTTQTGPAAVERIDTMPKASGLPMGMDSAAFNALSDSAKAAAYTQDKVREHGVFASLYEGEDKVIEVETDKYKVAIH